MLDNTMKNQTTNRAKSEWCLNEFTQKTTSQESNLVMRKFINSAIYVEKPVSASVSSESIPPPPKISSEDSLEPKTKRCTCSVNQKTCPCHSNSFFTFIPKEPPRKGSVSKISENRKKISQTLRFSNSTDDGKELIKKWIAKKEEERRKKEIEEQKILEAKLKEKEMLMEQDKSSFQKWLLNKKRIEERARKKKEKELEEKQLRELEKEKRQLENQLNFQLWVKKKEEVLLEKKIKKQMEFISELERKEQQLRENERAYDDWLKNSKNRQRPVPMNKGIQSLCSSSSVNYVNPNPWKSAP